MKTDLSRPVASQVPILLDPAARLHTAIFGRTRSGKTFRALVTLIRQQLRQRNSLVVVVDGKGSRRLFFALWQACQETGRRMRWVSTDPYHPSFLLNAFAQHPDNRRPTVTRMIETTLQSLELTYPEGYGPQYYAWSIRALL